MKGLEEYGEQLVKSNDEKESLTHSKQKEIFEELASEKMEEIQDLRKQIDFNNLTYQYNSNNVPKKAPLSFYRNIKDGYITLQKAGEQQK